MTKELISFSISASTMINTSEDPGPKRPGVIEKIVELSQKAALWLRANMSKFKQRLLALFSYLKGEKRLVINSAVLLIITLSPWISEISINQKVYADILKYSEPLDPAKAGELCESIGKFTPVINENKEDVALALMTENSSYSLSQQLSVNTDKKIKEPERQDATYTVAKGETITQIAEKFDLHVATIIDANDIPPEKAKIIQPGTVLKIPSSDTSISLDWLAKIHRAEEEERLAYQKKIVEENRKKQLTLSSSRALAASSSRYETGSGYDSIDNGEIGIPISHNGISRGYSSYHRGVDFMAPIGTPVYAAASGRVVITSGGWSGGYGNQTVIDHGGGRATRYAHLSSIAVSVGQTVGRGEVIGYSGNTGRSSGPHLHFELIIDGYPVPPF